MPLSELSVSTQNYLKEIWSLEEWTKTPATASALAERMGLRISSVSDGLKHLAAAHLISISRTALLSSLKPAAPTRWR